VQALSSNPSTTKKKKKKRWENSTMKIIKLCKKKLNKTQKDGKISHAHGLAELLL
jgi:hypothetical protein